MHDNFQSTPWEFLVESGYARLLERGFVHGAKPGDSEWTEVTPASDHVQGCRCLATVKAWSAIVRYRRLLSPLSLRVMPTLRVNRVPAQVESPTVLPPTNRCVEIRNKKYFYLRL